MTGDAITPFYTHLHHFGVSALNTKRIGRKQTNEYCGGGGGEEIYKPRYMKQGGIVPWLLLLNFKDLLYV